MSGNIAGKAAALLLLLALLLAPSPVLADRVDWRGFKEGKQQAGDAGKKMLVYFRTPWCGYCSQMEKKTFEDKEVAAFIEERFFPVKVNAESRKALAAAYMVQSYPTSWFLSSTGEKIRVLPGFVPAEPFLQVLRYIDSDSYNQMSFPEFLQKTD